MEWQVVYVLRMLTTLFVELMEISIPMSSALFSGYHDKEICQEGKLLLL
jgi:hypothetical protein